MRMKVYTIKMANKLYVATKHYNWYQSTTTDLSKAAFFTSYEEALKVQRQTIGGEIIEYLFTDESAEDTEELKSELIRVSKERDYYLNYYLKNVKSTSENLETHAVKSNLMF